jgi:drug/metabolite transporter (DMT)-like permease
MQSIPIIIGGSVMFGCVLGAVLLKEVLSFTGWIGVLMIAGGISLVGLDPGSTGLH